VERIALSADGRRLAIVRRMDAGASIELFVEVDGVWHAAASLTTPGDGAVSIAWRE
jgi:hypothetical protein